MGRSVDFVLILSATPGTRDNPSINPSGFAYEYVNTRTLAENSRGGA